MTRKTIISLALALGLLLMGAVAYGYGNDRGPRGVNKANGGYGCPYANVDRTAYNAKAAPRVRGSMPCARYGDGKVQWNNGRRYGRQYGHQYGHRNRAEHRCFRIFGTCW